MNDPIDLIAQLGVIPVISIDRTSDAVPLADALLEGGLPVVEITFRTPVAAEVLATIRDKRPELMIGAGTILDANSLDKAVGAGARFALAPGLDEAIIRAAQAIGLPFCPGIMTPTDLTAAARIGVGLAKFFPAKSAGGPAFLEAIATPFSHLGMRFVPTGGVSAATIGDWLRLKNVLAVGGTWIARSEDIRSGRFAEITANARAAARAAATALEARA